ncbi:MAG: hypothetical protein ACR9NN_11795 [Nostochopsis sp.]
MGDRGLGIGDKGVWGVWGVNNQQSTTNNQLPTINRQPPTTNN